MRRLLVLPLLLLAAQCQPLPRPFADDRPPADSPLLSPPDSAGIMVLPVMGAPTPAARALASAMAAALRAADVPASTDAHNQRSYRLLSTAREKPLDGGRSEIALAWELRNAAGDAIGRQTQTLVEPNAGWRAGDKALAEDAVRQVAPSLAKLVAGDAPLPAVGVDPVVALRGISGAPGDGARSLLRAMSNALGRANVAVAAEPGDKSNFVLTATVDAGPPASGKQPVKVTWTLAKPDGSEVGRVNQENAVPAGSLDHAWGDIAYAVANAAAPGIVAIIERAKRAAAGT
jgi:uncharacterized lipoprotein YmbA